jgi:subtilase family serine protease
MRRPVLAAVTSAAALVLSSFALATSAGAAPSSTGLHHRNDHVCSAPARGYASCDAIRQDTVDAAGHPAATASPDRTRKPRVTPAGLGPAQLRDAYNLTAASSGGKTVAIVDAYDAPNAAADLNTYRSTFGLPACTVASGCFTKISQIGSKTSLPRANGGWAQEISLDLDMVSAACPDCKILLVEAKSASFSDLATAVKKAASWPGVVAISNSYGGSDTGNTTIANAYNQPGKAVTASTGDSGYGAQSPATFPGVVAVGGTSLTRNANVARGWTESAWSGAGSGCSLYNAKPAYQTAATNCGKKADADVSAVADPNTGVAVYDSYAYQGYVGWMVFGGTSASSPFIAGVYAQGNALTSGSTAGAYTWKHPGALFDVTSGSNGSCPTSVWCHAGTGWDGPTGLGTPNGTGAF